MKPLSKIATIGLALAVAFTPASITPAFADPEGEVPPAREETPLPSGEGVEDKGNNTVSDFLEPEPDAPEQVQEEAPSPMRLRPDDTGQCTYDEVLWWVQRCNVWSPSMQRIVPMQIRPAVDGGDAALYLLDGIVASDVSNAWASQGTVMKAFENDDITLVMPVGGAVEFYTDWDRPVMKDGQMKTIKWETFLTKELPVYLQNNFGVNPTNNAIGGLSMGGTAALNLAALHPKQFKQVSSFSGFMQLSSPTGQSQLEYMMWKYGRLKSEDMWGGPASERRFENDPSISPRKYRNTAMFLSAASGLSGFSELNDFAPTDFIFRTVLEISAYDSTKEFDSEVRLAGANVTSNYPVYGIHSWKHWSRQMELARPQILGTLGVPEGMPKPHEETKSAEEPAVKPEQTASDSASAILTEDKPVE